MKSLQTYHIRAEESYHIHQKNITDRFLNPWEIWYVKLWCNIGNEIDGKEAFLRPFYVIKILGNIIICLPMTSKIKNNSFQFKLSSNSAIILDQIKSFDKKRFIKRVSTIDKNTQSIIKKATQELLLK